ncbi:MAG: DUF2586 family protein [Bacteroidales bacterium]|nr:DUF2586 family protein [Bacteroidales bacterium]
MGYPGVDIQIQSGQLGAVASTNDGICGLIIADDPGSTNIEAGKVYTFTSIDDVKNTDFKDIAFAFGQISEFYLEAGSGSKLHVMLVPNTETMEDICDAADDNAYAKQLLHAANGEINFLGVCRKPNSTAVGEIPAYNATHDNGLDDDAYNALSKAQSLCDDYAAMYQPCFAIIEGREFQGILSGTGALTDIRSASFNRASIAICSTDSALTVTKNNDGEITNIDHDGSASVGLVLGRIAAIPVQRKISRVKSGALAIPSAYIADASITTGISKGYTKIEDAKIETITGLGYISIRHFTGRVGYYFADDPLATTATDDYNCITNRRVIDKAIRIVYNTYINELNDEIEIAPDGTISPAVAKSYQGLIENAVNQLMTANDEVSSFSAFVDINQNVLSTGRLVIECKIVPVGYSREIVVKLGFDNPALSN